MTWIFYPPFNNRGVILPIKERENYLPLENLSSCNENENVSSFKGKNSSSCYRRLCIQDLFCWLCKENLFPRGCLRGIICSFLTEYFQFLIYYSLGMNWSFLKTLYFQLLSLFNSKLLSCKHSLIILNV